MNNKQKERERLYQQFYDKFIYPVIDSMMQMEISDISIKVTQISKVYDVDHFVYEHEVSIVSDGKEVI